jgi:hypothetical protein
VDAGHPTATLRAILVASLDHVAWTERARGDDRLLLVVDLRPITGLAVAALPIGGPWLAMPLVSSGPPHAPARCRMRMLLPNGSRRLMSVP